MLHWPPIHVKWKYESLYHLKESGEQEGHNFESWQVYGEIQDFRFRILFLNQVVEGVAKEEVAYLLQQ
ncbi:hypothetical protein bcgnr5416_34230 [Bacillus cereus]|nr:hypothetical protein BCJMU07_1958 [Bacillus cereus]BCC76311.1 hypothetical protein BCJMU62_2002 [Bacillus cereus]